MSGTGLNGMAKRIAWGEPGAAAPPVLPEIIRPAIGEQLEVVLLDSLPCSVWLHWTGKRSVPHLIGKDACQHCLQGLVAKQYAYMSAWYLRRERIGLAEVTAHALSRCPELLQPSAARPLRGRHAILSRSTGHRSSRCWCRLLDAMKAEPLPAGLDVRAVLEHLWGFDPQTRQALGLDPTGQSDPEENRHED